MRGLRPCADHGHRPQHPSWPCCVRVTPLRRRDAADRNKISNDWHVGERRTDESNCPPLLCRSRAARAVGCAGRRLVRGSDVRQRLSGEILLLGPRGYGRCECSSCLSGRGPRLRLQVGRSRRGVAGPGLPPACLHVTAAQAARRRLPGPNRRRRACGRTLGALGPRRRALRHS